MKEGFCDICHGEGEFESSSAIANRNAGTQTRPIVLNKIFPHGFWRIKKIFKAMLGYLRISSVTSKAVLLCLKGRLCQNIYELVGC